MTALPSGELHVWTVDLGAGPETAEGELAILSESERERAGRFVFPEDRRRFAGSHAALRRVLAAYLGKPAVALDFLAGPHGKPALAEPPGSWLRFNLSHSRDLALIACARDREVGIDVEWMRDGVDCAEVAGSCFSPQERAEWATLPAARQRDAFFRGWTSKEAYVKALGLGLSHPSGAYTVRLDPAGEAELLGDSLRAGSEKGWSLQAVAVPPGYIAAVAVEGVPARVVSRWWRPE